MIPKGTWFNNVRTSIGRSSWDKLRKQIYDRVEYKCACCNIDCRIRTSYTGCKHEHRVVVIPARDPKFIGEKVFVEWNTIQIDARERWSFDYKNKIQKLERIVALCHRCHTAAHVGLARVMGLGQLAKRHMKKVNNWNDEQVEDHLAERTARAN